MARVFFFHFVGFNLFAISKIYHILIFWNGKKKKDHFKFVYGSSTSSSYVLVFIIHFDTSYSNEIILVYLTERTVLTYIFDIHSSLSRTGISYWCWSLLFWCNCSPFLMNKIFQVTPQKKSSRDRCGDRAANQLDRRFLIIDK